MTDDGGGGVAAVSMPGMEDMVCGRRQFYTIKREGMIMEEISVIGMKNRKASVENQIHPL